MPDITVTIKVPALEKLVEYTTSGIGAVAGPILSNWRAKKLAISRRIEAQGGADARDIEARGDATALKIISVAQKDALGFLNDEGDTSRVVTIDSRGIQQCIEFQEKKRLYNIQSVVHHAADIIGEQEVPDVETNHDWTARFFREVQDVSSEEM